MADTKPCETCGCDTIPTEEAGENWLNCTEYTGRGAQDPSGASMPEGWLVTDLIKTVKVFRDRKMIEIEPTQFIKGKDKVIKAILDETIIADLYDGDPRAITVNDPNGRNPQGKTDGWTRLEWYTEYGRDPLRVLATSRIKLGLQTPVTIGKVGK